MNKRDTGKIGKVAKRHYAGNHSQGCKIWDYNYQGEVCKYTWEPYGETAMDKLMEQDNE